MKLKVYGWTALIRNAERQQLGLASHIIQCRCIIAARSMAQVGRLVGRPPRTLFNLTQTGNAQEIAIASAEPGTFFVRGLDQSGPYHKVVPGAVS